MSLRGWLLEQSDDELEALKGSPRFSTTHNRRVLDTVLRERHGEQNDSWEDAIETRRSIPLSANEWRALERIAAETGSLAARGDNAGNPSWRTMLRRIASGELRVEGSGVDNE